MHLKNAFFKCIFKCILKHMGFWVWIWVWILAIKTLSIKTLYEINKECFFPQSDKVKIFGLKNSLLRPG
jgi:hypothetical protein